MKFNFTIPSIMYIYIQGRGITILKSPHPHLLAQPWQGQSRKQAKMTQAYSSKANMNKLCELKQNQRYSPIKKK